MNPSNDMTLSPLIIGTMRLGEWGANLSTQELEYFIDACLDLGFTDFDHADIYGHYTDEAKFGTVLKRRPDLRHKIQHTTKCGIKLISERRPNHKIKHYDSSKTHIIWSAENALQKLGVDHIELFLLHRPDNLMNPHEIAAAITQLKEAGKVKNFGVSNFTTSQIDLIHSFTPIINHQIEISPLHRDPFEDGTLDQCLRHNIAPTAWSPFAGGKLFQKTDDPTILRIQNALEELALIHEATFDQLLIAWLRKHPAGITPILGTTKIERLQKAKKALTITLSHQEWYQIWEAAIGQEVA